MRQRKTRNEGSLYHSPGQLTVTFNQGWRLRVHLPRAVALADPRSRWRICMATIAEELAIARYDDELAIYASTAVGDYN
jgi:hypothetical protein